MSTQSIVCTGPIDETATTILEPFGQIVMAADGQEQTLLQLAEHAVALVVRGEGVVTAKVIETASQLRVIGRSGSGYNNVDIASATARRIPVVYTPGANAQAVAEAAMTMMLALSKHLVY